MRHQPLPPPGRDRAIAELAARQHGVAAHRQLAAIGLSPQAIARGVGAGRLHPLHRGVYAVGHTIVAARGRWLAAVLACGPGALLSHRSAGALWALRQTASAKVDVTVSRGGSHGHSRIAVHRSRCLLPADRARIDNIPVTSLPRTLLDLAETLSPHKLELAVEAAERRRLLDLRAIDELLERSNGRHGIKALRTALSLPSGTLEARSPLERRFIAFCRMHDLPRPRLNVIVAGHEVDANWPSAKLVVELDSVEFHHTRAAFERDRSKDIEFQLAGQRVIRVTDRRLEGDPGRLAAEIRWLLAGRRG